MAPETSSCRSAVQLADRLRPRGPRNNSDFEVSGSFFIPSHRQGAAGPTHAPAIENLNLYFAEQVTDEGMSIIKGWKRLKKLNVRGTKVTDTTLEFVSSIPTLESLDIGYAEITDVGLDRLTSMPNLRELTIGGKQAHGYGSASAPAVPQSTYLDVGGMQRTDSGLWSVTLTDAGVESMRRLWNCVSYGWLGRQSAADLERLKSLSRLERLSLQNCKRVGDEGVPVLSTLAKLRVLDVKGTGITANGAAELRKNLPNTQVLYWPAGSAFHLPTPAFRMSSARVRSRSRTFPSP